MSRSVKAMRVLVSGRVQGVFFRTSTLQCSIDLEINGWVRNLNDGRVECKAVGIESNLLVIALDGEGTYQGKGRTR